MGLGKFLLYGSLLTLPFVSLEKISAITCMPWNLSTEIDEHGKFIKENTEKVSCDVDSNYRNWDKKIIVMKHDMKNPILRIDYKNSGKFYSEFWDGRNLIALLADKLYHFNL